MANTITSPNMSLSIPVTGVDPGPDYANNINASLVLIDQHNHSGGQGVQINPSGILINADLPFNDNNLTLGRSIRFQTQTSPISLVSDIGCLYESGVDLYYNDGNGNQIRITQSGSVSGSTGTITGLPSGTASASYGAGTFVFQSATATSAVLDAGSVILRNNSANSHGLTLSPPNSMAANFQLVLPSIPGATSFLQIDTSGNITAGPAIAGGITNTNIANGGIVSSNIAAGTIVSSNIASGTITGSNIAATTITGSNIVNNTITRAQEAAVGQVVSSGSGAFSTTSGSNVAVTNLSVTLTTTGRPVIVGLYADPAVAPSQQTDLDVNTNTVGFLYILRDGTTIGQYRIQPNANVCSFPGFTMDVPSAGSHTYAIQVSVAGGYAFQVNNFVLAAYEL